MAKKKSPVKHFFDQSFQGKEKQLGVQIQLSKRQLYFAYFYSPTNSYVGVEEYYLGENDSWHQAYAEIEDIFSTFDKPYKQYTIAVIDSYFSLVPSPLFSADASKDYLQLSHRDTRLQMSYHHNTIESANTTIVFAIPEQLLQLIKRHFTTYQLFHFSSPLIEYSEINKPAIKEQLQLHIQKHHFEAISYKLGKLRFFNSFTYKTEEDFIYYLLYVMEQLKIDREKVPLQLYGEFEESASLYKTLYKYVKQLNILPLPKELQLSAVLSKLPKQYYRNLYNQYLCE